MSNTENAELPQGCMVDAQGRYVPEELVRPIDKLRDQLVADIVGKAIALNKALRDFKASAFSDIATFIEISAERYEVIVGGRKGNVTLRSYSGRYKVERAIQESISFDEQLQAAKSLIDECITEWSAGSRPEIRALVNDAFQVDQEGRISTQRVLGLKRLDIKGEKWTSAMEAIAQSVTVVGSKAYVRVYQRVGATDRYEAIPLDIAAV